MTAPANDNFADAVVLTGSLPITLTGETNVDATTEVDEPRSVNFGEVDPADEDEYIGASVWYAWTCGTAGGYRFTIESDADLALTVFSGGTAFGDLERLDQMDWPFEGSSQVESVYFSGSVGQTYYFQVGLGRDWYDHGPDVFDLALESFSLPANDNFEDAQELLISVEGYTFGATTEAEEPLGLMTYGGIDYYEVDRSVWYYWVAPSSDEVTLTLDATGKWAADGLPMFAVLTGTAVNDLTYVTPQGYFGDELTFTPVEGETYYIQVGGYPYFTWAEGDFTLWFVGITPPPPPVPSNDFFAEADTITLSGGSATVTDSNVGETTETGEPLTFSTFGFAGTVSSTVWWNWIADSDGVATFDTFGSDFDTTAAVFTGGSLSGLTCLAFNDNYEGGTATIEQSLISWDAVEDTTYHLQVASAGTASGSITAHLYFDPYPAGDPPTPPPPLTVSDPYRIELRTLNSAGFTVTTESLELTSFSCNWRLNAPGAFEGSGVIGTTQADAANVGARELIVYKGTGENETAIWGGYLTFFNVDEDTKRVRVGAEGYWSRARSRLMRGNQIYKPVTNAGVAWKADVIAWDIIDQAQGASYGDMGWIYGGHSGTRKNCKRIYYGVDRNNIGEAIEALARDGYFDFSVDVRQAPAAGDVATFRTWYKRGSDRSSSINLSASNAMTLNLSLSSSDMSTVIDVFGSVEGCRGVAATDTSNLATYGRVEARPIDMETDEQAEVDAAAADFIDQHGVPARNATVTYLEGVGPDLTDYDIGDTIRVTPADGYVSYFDGRVVGREVSVEAARAVITVEVER